MSDTEDERAVAVTSKGQATIPKEFRDKLRINTPGRVRFVETADGDIVIRPVERPSELRGSLAAEDGDEAAENSATELLREERERDKTELDNRHGLSERTE
jgi:AbrB family looped-hinge helix DNA binding protein